MKALVEPHYFPCLEYFCALLRYDEVVVEQYEYYVKQSFRNRCYINTAHGKQMLTVPLDKESGKMYIKDIRLQPGVRWRNNHWRTIQSAYANAPFFEHFSEEVRSVIFGKSDWLIDLDTSSLSFCLRSLRSSKKLLTTTTYEMPSTSAVFDLRSKISDKIPDRSRHYYQPVAYYQVFGSAFASNLSVLDLLFCEGPSAPAILSASLWEK